MKKACHSQFADEQLLNGLMHGATKKDELSQKYDVAKDIDELILIASERLCISAATIMFSLKGPERGNLILRVLKKIRPKSYESYWNRNNNLFAQCVFLLIEKLKIFMSQKDVSSSTPSLFTQLISWAGVHYYTINHFGHEDKERFKKHLIETLIEYEDNPPKDDNEQLSRIIKAHGKKPKGKELALFINASLISDPLLLLNPFDFVANYRRLVNSS